MSIIRIIVVGLLSLFVTTGAPAQQYMTLPPNSLVGNLKPQTRPGSTVTLEQLVAALSQFGLVTSSSGGTAGHLAVWGPTGGLVDGASVSNSLLAAMPAFSIKANATNLTSVPTDISIPALPQKVSPVSGDMIMIVDSAASNALKMATVGSVASAGSVSSLDGKTGSFSVSTGIKVTAGNDVQLSLTNASVAAAPGSPTGTNSATGKMQGLGASCRITPVYSGRVVVSLDFDFTSTTAAVSAASQLKFGSGAPPANGDAPTGTSIGNARTGYVAISNARVPASHHWILTGLSIGTQTWIDASLSTASGNTVSMAGANCVLHEF